MDDLLAIYHKIPFISPGLTLVQKAFLLDLFQGSIFLEGLLSEGILHFKMGLACQ